MPRATNRVALEGSLGEWATEMRTRFHQRKDNAVAFYQHDVVARELGALRLSLRKLVFAKHRRKFGWEAFGNGVICADLLPKRKMPAEITTEQHGGETTVG